MAESASTDGGAPPTGGGAAGGGDEGGGVRGALTAVDNAANSVLLPLVQSIRKGVGSIFNAGDAIKRTASGGLDLADGAAQSAAEVVAWPLAQLRHSAIPPQAVLGGALLTGLATATVLGKMKGKGGKRPGIFRKTALFVRQPTLFVGGTLLFIYPQYFAQQLGLRTHKPAPAGGALPPASPKPDPAAQAELNEQKLLEAAEAAAAKARAAAEAAEAAERREQDAAAEAARAKAEKNARAQEQAEHRRQEAARVQAEEAARAQQEAEEETLRKLRAKEAEERRRQEAAAAAAAAAARQQEQERADAAAASAAKKEEEEEQARQAEAARVKAEAEAARLKAEAEAQAAADEAAARAAAEEQEAQAREAEAARRKQEAEAQAAADALADITKRTKAKGDEIRAAKRSRASRQAVGVLINELNALKAEYEKTAGHSWRHRPRG